MKDFLSYLYGTFMEDLFNIKRWLLLFTVVICFNLRFPETSPLMMVVIGTSTLCIYDWITKNEMEKK